MRRFFGSMGTVSRVTVESPALKSNMLGDPSERVVDVVRLRENLPERLDRLIGEQFRSLLEAESLLNVTSRSGQIASNHEFIFYDDVAIHTKRGDLWICRVVCSQGTGERDHEPMPSRQRGQYRRRYRHALTRYGDVHLKIVRTLGLPSQIVA
jgi:hypothetical protein